MPALQHQTAAPATGPKTGRNGIALKPPAAQFHTTEPAVQLIKNSNGYKWSDGELFAAAGTPFLGADPSYLPALKGITWNKEGSPVKFGKKKNATELDLYRPRWNDDKSVLKVPKDCITTAELITAWLTGQSPTLVGEVKTTPTISKAKVNTTVNPGDILFHTHSSDPGDFHGAGVIAKDGDDVITMESDSSKGNKIASMAPIFDMYEGHAGFRDSQLGSKLDEKTYVIKFSNANTRKSQTLWKGIQDEIDKGNYTDAGKDAATKIKDAI